MLRTGKGKNTKISNLKFGIQKILCSYLEWILESCPPPGQETIPLLCSMVMVVSGRQHISQIWSIILTAKKIKANHLLYIYLLCTTANCLEHESLCPLFLCVILVFDFTIATSIKRRWWWARSTLHSIITISTYTTASYTASYTNCSKEEFLTTCCTRQSSQSTIRNCITKTTSRWDETSYANEPRNANGHTTSH